MAIISGRAHVMVGKPIYIADIIDESLETSENIKKITDFVRNKIIELRDETEKRKQTKA